VNKRVCDSRLEYIPSGPEFFENDNSNNAFGVFLRGASPHRVIHAKAFALSSSVENSESDGDVGSPGMPIALRTPKGIGILRRSLRRSLRREFPCGRSAILLYLLYCNKIWRKIHRYKSSITIHLGFRINRGEWSRGTLHL